MPGDKEPKEVAIKLPNKLQEDLKELLQEGRNLAKVSASPHAVKVLGYVVPEGADSASKDHHHGLVIEIYDTNLWDLMGVPKDGKLNLSSAQLCVPLSLLILESSKHVTLLLILCFASWRFVSVNSQHPK